MSIMQATVRIMAAVVLVTVAVAAWSQPQGFSVNSRGNFSDDEMNDSLWRVNLATGESVRIGFTGWLDLEALAFDSEGRLFGADDDTNTLVRIGTGTGNAFAVNNAQHNMGIPIDQTMDFGMTFTCDGRLLVVSDVRQSLFEADPGTGQLTLIDAEGSLGAPITDIAVRGDTVYGIGQGLDGAGNTDSPFLYRLDIDAPGAEVIGPLGAAASPYNNAGLAFDSEGELWAITDRRQVGGNDFPSEILNIDPETGMAEKISDTGVVGQESLAIAPTGGCGSGTPPPPTAADDFVQIPALGRPAALILLMLFALAAGIHLRR